MKRGESGLSFCLGIDKPCGISSHDVVSRVRRIFGERRVGHAGTLDPLASGVLIVCVGPATRLDKYLVGHDKTYVVDVAFGAATETDDEEGAVTEKLPVPPHVFDNDFASNYAQTLTGKIMQVPPVYSALKKGGKKACDEARRGNTVQLEPREVEIYSVVFQELLMPNADCEYVRWRLEVSVSKGTYLRSFARDLGKALGTVAHVSYLRRVQSGCLPISHCVKLEELDLLSPAGIIDPLPLLGYRFAFVEDTVLARVQNGNALRAGDLVLREQPAQLEHASDCCFPTYHTSTRPPEQGEYLALLSQNTLVAIYQYESEKKQWKADCIFKPPVMREKVQA